MDKARILIVIAIYVAMIVACLMLPFFKSPGIASKIIADCGMLVLVITVVTLLSKLEPGSNDHRFWKDCMIAGLSYLAVRIVKSYLLCLALGINGGYLELMNFGYVIPALFICKALFESMKNYTLKLSVKQRSIVAVLGVGVLIMTGFMFFSSVASADFGTASNYIAAVILAILGITLVVASMTLLFKTIGGQIQYVVLALTAGNFFMFAHQFGIIIDKIRGYANSAESTTTSVTYYLFCMMYAISVQLRVNLSAQEAELDRSFLE